MICDSSEGSVTADIEVQDHDVKPTTVNYEYEIIILIISSQRFHHSLIYIVYKAIVFFATLSYTETSKEH